MGRTTRCSRFHPWLANQRGLVAGNHPDSGFKRLVRVCFFWVGDLAADEFRKRGWGKWCGTPQDSGLAESRSEGLQVIYRLSDDQIPTLSGYISRIAEKRLAEVERIVREQ